jgi:2'-5' RNA ligase
MRLFFAIEFKEELKEFLFNIQQDVREHCIGGNFTSKDNFHLTLRFIGEQSPSQAERLISVLNDTADSFKDSEFKPAKTRQYLQNGGSPDVGVEVNTYGFELRLNKIGKFDRGNKKIIWVGLKRSRELENLYNKLENTLINHGYNKEDRGFNPHITLAREVKIDGFEQLVNKIEIDTVPIEVRAISLMESKRIDNKLCYVPLVRAEI